MDLSRSGNVDLRLNMKPAIGALEARQKVSRRRSAMAIDFEEEARIVETVASPQIAGEAGWMPALLASVALVVLAMPAGASFTAVRVPGRRMRTRRPRRRAMPRT
ncbi:hypothetical protein ACOJBO_08150 [Rhizobium beringeri]